MVNSLYLLTVAMINRQINFFGKKNMLNAPARRFNKKFILPKGHVKSPIYFILVIWYEINTLVILTSISIALYRSEFLFLVSVLSLI